MSQITNSGLNLHLAERTWSNYSLPLFYHRNPNCTLKRINFKTDFSIHHVIILYITKIYDHTLDYCRAKNSDIEISSNMQIASEGIVEMSILELFTLHILFISEFSPGTYFGLKRISPGR